MSCDAMACFWLCLGLSSSTYSIGVFVCCLLSELVSYCLSLDGPPRVPRGSSCVVLCCVVSCRVVSYFSNQPVDKCPARKRVVRGPFFVLLPFPICLMCAPPQAGAERRINDRAVQSASKGSTYGFLFECSYRFPSSPCSFYGAPPSLHTITIPPPTFHPMHMVVALRHLLAKTALLLLSPQHRHRKQLLHNAAPCFSRLRRPLKGSDESPLRSSCAGCCRITAASSAASSPSSMGNSLHDRRGLAMILRPVVLVQWLPSGEAAAAAATTESPCNWACEHGVCSVNENEGDLQGGSGRGADGRDRANETVYKQTKPTDKEK